MRYAKIIDGVVVNVELWNDPPTRDGVTFVELVADSPVGIDYTWDGETFTAPEPPAPAPEPVPFSITKGQLYRGLARDYQFSEDHVNAVVAGILSQMPDGPEKTDAQLNWKHAVEIYRINPLVDIVGQVLGLTPEQIDELYRTAVARDAQPPQA